MRRSSLGAAPRFHSRLGPAEASNPPWPLALLAAQQIGSLGLLGFLLELLGIHCWGNPELGLSKMNGYNSISSQADQVKAK